MLKREYVRVRMRVSVHVNKNQQRRTLLGQQTAAIKQAILMLKQFSVKAFAMKASYVDHIHTVILLHNYTVSAYYCIATITVNFICIENYFNH